MKLIKPKIFLTIVICIVFQLHVFSQNESKYVASAWFSYAMSMQDSIFGGYDGQNLFRSYLFPDDKVKFNFNGTYKPADFRSIGVVLDPYAPVFHEKKMSHLHHYSLDTIKIPLFYTRNIQNNVGDTLEIELLTNFQAPLRETSNTFYSNTYGVDTMRFYYLFVNPATLKIDKVKFQEEYNSLGLPQVEIRTIKYVLEQKDVIPDPEFGSPMIKIPTPDVICSPGTFIAATFKFLPGYSYVNGDNMSTKNYVEFFSFEMNGPNTFPTYTEGDMNSSHFLIPTILEPGNPWYGKYSVHWAFTSAAQSFENNLVYFKLTYDKSADISDFQVQSDLFMNVPNPVTDYTCIHYRLNETSVVSLIISDMLGRQVQKIEKGKQFRGEYSVTIDTSEFPSGIYLYSLVTEKGLQTRKMIKN